MESTLLKTLKHGYDMDRTLAVRRTMGGRGGTTMSGGGRRGERGRTTIWTAQKQKFFAAVMATTVVQLLVTFGVFRAARKRVEKIGGLTKALTTLLYVALLLVLVLVPMPVYLKFALYTAAAVCQGMVLAVVAHGAPDQLVHVVLLGTIAIFGVMLGAGLLLATMGVDLGWMAGLFMVALVGLIVARLIDAFMKDAPKRKKWLSAIGLVLFSAFIVFDTNVMLHKDYANDFVGASIDLFLDFVMVFRDLLVLNRD